MFYCKEYTINQNQNIAIEDFTIENVTFGFRKPTVNTFLSSMCEDL